VYCSHVKRQIFSALVMHVQKQKIIRLNTQVAKCSLWAFEKSEHVLGMVTTPLVKYFLASADTSWEALYRWRGKFYTEQFFNFSSRAIRGYFWLICIFFRYFSGAFICTETINLPIDIFLHYLYWLPTFGGYFNIKIGILMVQTETFIHQ
jgi:hypothetical protein